MVWGEKGHIWGVWGEILQGAGSGVVGFREQKLPMARSESGFPRIVSMRREVIGEDQLLIRQRPLH